MESASQAAAEMEVKLAVCFLCDYILAEVHEPVFKSWFVIGAPQFQEGECLNDENKGLWVVFSTARSISSMRA